MSLPLAMSESRSDIFFLLLIIASRISFSVNDLRIMVEIWISITNRIRNEKTTIMPINASFNPSKIIAASQTSHQAYIPISSIFDSPKFSVMPNLIRPPEKSTS
jgi:hypothetical protein